MSVLFQFVTFSKSFKGTIGFYVGYKKITSTICNEMIIPWIDFVACPSQA